MTSHRPSRRHLRRAFPIVATILLHLAVYGLVNAWNATRPPGDFVDVSLPVDGWIPYLPRAVVPYYLADLFVLGAGTAVLWRMEERRFLRGLGAYVGVILAGGAIQLLLPITAPWPPNPAPLQRFFHGLPGVEPYAALPSMHVTLAVLPAAMGQDVFESRWARAFLVLGAAAATVTTLLAKEHYALDAVAGLALGVLAWLAWRGGFPAP